MMEMRVSRKNELTSRVILKCVNNLQDLIEITLRRMDLDRDGRVSFEDFKYVKMY